MSALRSAPKGIGFETTRGGATARASASTARAWRRTPAAGSAPAGQLDHERAVAGEGRVLPGDRRAVVAREPLARQARARASRAARAWRRRCSSRPCERLVVPERHARALALDEALDHLGLRLGGGPGARLVDAVLAAASGRGSCGSGPRRPRCGACRRPSRPGWRPRSARARCRAAGATRRRRATTALPAGSLPCTAPTTSTFTRARGQPTRSARIGRPSRGAADRLPAPRTGRGRPVPRRPPAAVSAAARIEQLPEYGGGL